LAVFSVRNLKTALGYKAASLRPIRDQEKQVLKTSKTNLSNIWLSCRRD
jgi:hypothetical protein